MSTTPDELRKAMASAQVAGKGQHIESGLHLLEVANALVRRSVIDGTAKETYILEFIVIESSNPTHVPGSTRSLAESTKNAGWIGRFKAALFACAGIDPNGTPSPEDEKTVQDIIAAIRFDEERIKLGWPQNFLRGRRVFVEGFPGKSRSGFPITEKKWKVPPPELQETDAAR